MVMYPVQTRCNNQARELGFKCHWQAQIGVMKKRGQSHHSFKYHHRIKRNRKDEYNNTAHQSRKHHLAEMKSDRRGRIQHFIAVMHLMKTPQKWHDMIDAVPAINP